MEMYPIPTTRNRDLNLQKDSGTSHFQMGAGENSRPYDPKILVFFDISQQTSHWSWFPTKTLRLIRCRTIVIVNLVLSKTFLYPQNGTMIPILYIYSTNDGG